MSEETTWASTPDGIAFFNGIFTMTRQAGQIVLEIFDCDGCGMRTILGHYWQESMPCSHCGARMSSKTPRRPQAGEVTMDHMTTALETLRECYQNSLNAIPDTTSAKWGELTAEIQLIITQTATRLVVSALTQVDNLAVSLAKLKK